jgi:ribose transport system substrate-binding protein
VRKLTVIIALLLLTVLSGCNMELYIQNEMPEVYAFIHSSDGTHTEQMIKGLEAGAAEWNADLDIQKINVTDDDTGTALRAIKQAIRRSTKAIIITPFEHDELYKLMKKAHQKGISLIYLDALQKYDTPGTYITSDNEAAAEKAGQMLADAIGQRGDIIMLNTVADNPKAIDREAGFRKSVADYPDVRLINIFYCSGDRQNTQKTLQDIYASHPDIKGIFAACPETSAAAAAWAKNHNIRIVGFDHTEETLEYIRKGQFHGCVSQKSYDMGYKAVKAALNRQSDQTESEQIEAGYEVITAADLVR